MRSRGKILRIRLQMKYLDRLSSEIFEFVVWLRETIRHQHQYLTLKYSAADKIYMPLFASSTISDFISDFTIRLYTALRETLLCLCLDVLGDPWSYIRGFTHASLPADEPEMPNMFIDWLRYLFNSI